MSAKIRARSQISSQTFAPVQEISNSIYSMMKRVAKLSDCETNDPEYLTLLNRIKTQAFCLQEVCKDRMMKNSNQYLRLLEYFQKLSNDQQTKPLVKHCASEILKIIKGECDMFQTITYKPVIPSPQMMTNFYRAANKMDKNFELAERDPDAYKRKAKIDLTDPENNDFEEFHKEERKENDKNQKSYNASAIKKASSTKISKNGR